MVNSTTCQMLNRSLNPEQGAISLGRKLITPFVFMLVAVFMLFTQWVKAQTATYSTGQTVITYSTAGTYTYTGVTGITPIQVEAWGGGGGGGGAGTNTNAAGGGGGGGGCSINPSVSVSGGTGYTVVVGSGGANGVAAGGTGTAGGASTFATTTVVANGGAAGSGTTSATVGGAGGNGAAVGTGTTTYTGGNGATGVPASAGGGGGGSAGNTGNGGNASAGTGGTAGTGGGVVGGAGGTTTAGTAGGAPGAGGGGGRRSATTNRAGGAGGAGQVKITYTCNPISTLPWNEGFEGLPLTAAANIEPYCWTYTNITSNNYTCSSTCNSNTARTGTNFLGGSWSFDVWHFTPAFQLTGGTSYDFSFYYRTTDLTAGYTLTTGYGTSAAAASMTTLGTITNATSAGAYTLVKYTVTPASSGTYYFGLHNACPTSSPNGIAFDDFSLGLTPTCTVPTALTATATSSTAANLGWTAPGSGSPVSYNWEVRTSGAGGSGATGLTASGNVAAPTVTASTSALAANTTYNLYVRTYCGGTDYSAWVGPIAFTTPCAATSPGWTESFETVTVGSGTGSGSYLPSCWYEIGDWTTASGNVGTYQKPRTGTKFIYTNWTADDWLFTPTTTLTGGVSYDFTYYYIVDNNGGSGSTAFSTELKYGASQSVAAMTNAISTLANVTTTSTYTKVTKTFTPAVTGDYTIGIHVFVSSTTPNYFSFDDISLAETPACPTAPTIGTITTTATTASIPFTCTSCTGNFIAEYSTTSGFTPGTGATAGGGTVSSAVTTSPIGLSGLTPNTTYYVYVRNNCSAGNYSPNSTVASLTTPCAAAAIPVTEGFEGLATANTLPACWGASDLGNKCKTYIASATGTNSALVARTGNKFAAIYYSPSAVQGWFYSIPVQLTGGVSYRAQVYYKTDGVSWTDAGLYYGTSATSAAMTNTIASVSSAAATNYTAITGDFIPASTGVYYIGIRAYNSTTSPNYIAFDDFSVDLTPTCLAPTALTAVATSATAANLSWTAPATGSPASYEWEVRTTGAGGSGATGLTVSGSVTAPTVSTSTTSLTANTSYSLYVRTNCGGSGFSTWAGPVTFTTPCATVTLTQSEGFNTAANTTFPICWSQQLVSGTKNITFETTGSNPTTSPQEGTRMVYWNSFSNSGSQTRLVSLPLNTTGVTSVDVEFQWRNENNTSYNSGAYVTGEGVQIQYSTDGATWTDAGSFVSRHDGTLASGTAQWNKKTITVASAGNQSVVYIGFLFKSNAGDNSYMDAVVIKPTPTCFPPTALTATATSATAANLSWTAPATGTPASYDWEVRTTGAGGSGATGLTASGSVTAPTIATSTSALAANTTYNLYVRTNCGSGDFSSWAGPVSFTTPCASVTIPYFQNFDGVTQPAIPSCHSVENTNGDTYTWKTCTSTSLGNSSAITPNSGTNQLGIAYNSDGTTAMNDWFYLPSFNLVAGTSYRLTFWCRPFTNATYSEKLEVKYGTAPASGSMSNIIAANFTLVGGTSYAQKTYDFTPASSGTYFIGFHGNSVANQDYLFVDDIGLDLTPTCFAPTALTAAPTSTTSANISWTAPATGTPTAYEWEVRTSGAGGSGATGLTASGSTTAPTVSTSTSALAANTTYSLYVRTGCGGSDYSGWAGPVTFTTPCNVATIPYTQNFDGVTQPAIPGCHTVENTNADANIWKTCNSTSLGNFSSITPNSGTNQLGIAFNSGAAMDDWFFTPSFNLTAGTYYRLSFWYRGYNSATYTEQMEVKYGTSATSAAMTNSIVSTFSIPGNVAYTKKTIDFTPASSGTYNIGFHGNSIANQYYIFVDDIGLDLSPSCFDPVSVTATSSSATTANIGWTAPIAPPASGYQWEVRTSGAAGSGATGLSASGSTAAGVTSATATGLTANTAYAVYVRSNCGAGGFSNWTTPVVVTTTLDCSTATNITCGVAASYSVAGATGAYNFAGTSPTNSCGNATPGPEQFFSFTPAITGSYKFDGVKTGSANVSVLYKNTNLGCGPTGYTCLGVINAGGFSTNVTLTSGNTYLFIVDNQSSVNSATGTITVTCPCTGTPSAGVIGQTSPQSVCGTAATLALTNNAVNSGTGITYQWEESNDNGVTDAWANAVGGSGATTLSYTTPAITQGIYYRVKATCSASALSATSAPLQVIQNPNPAALITPSPASLCLGGSASLAASPSSGMTYAWSGSAGSAQTVTVSPVASTTYTVTVTNATTTCSATASSAVTVNPAPPVTTDASMCVGGSGTLTATVTCGPQFTLNNTFGMSDIPATGAPTYLRGQTGVTYVATSGVVSYTTIVIRPTVTGSYVINGCGSGDTHMQLYQGTFTPATPATNFVAADDDGNTSTCASDPRLTVTLTAGQQYVLVYTPFSGTGAVTSITITVTPPSGGAMETTNGTPGTLTWYTAATGGTALATGASFNPVGVSGSGLTNTNTAGTYTYYAGCTSNPTCRTAANFIINAKPVVTPAAAPATICNGAATILNANATAGSGTITTYAWGSGIAGNNASGSVSPTTTSSYTVTVTNSNSCTASGTATVTVNTCGVNSWLGNTTDWHTATNWSNGFVPTTCAHNVLIPNLANDPIVSTPVAVGDIELQNGSTLTLNAALSACGNFKGGAATSSQVLGTAALTLNGSSLQQLSGKATFTTLRLNNAAGATLQTGSTFQIFKALELQAGNLNTTSGTLHFRSTAAATYAVLDNFSAGFTGTITGNIKAERFYSAAGAISHYQHLLGSPVNNAPLSAFGASGTAGYILPLSTCDEDSVDPSSPFGTVFSYDETQGTTCSAAGWKVEVTGTMANAQGYSVWKAGSGAFTVTGAPNLNSSYTAANLGNANWNNTTKQGRPVASGWHLVANPFLADLDISSTPAGFDPNKMVWHTSGAFAGSYQPAMVVAPFQAFMVRKSVAGGSAGYTINATQRTRSASPTFQKQANDHELTITAINNTTNLLDVTNIAFNSDASEAFDPGYDGIKSAGALTRHTLYTYMADANTWLLLNNVKDIETTSTIPMGFEPGVDGSYSLSFEGITTFDPTSYVMLEDKKLNVFHDVRNGNYNFNAVATDNWGRFVLHFTPAAKFNSSNATCEAQGQISITQPGTANWNYTIVNSNNVVIGSGSLNNNNSVATTVAAGVYTVTMVDNNGYTVVKNIQVNGVSPINATMQASSTVAEAGEDITFISTTANAATTNWNFGDGTTQTTATTTHTYTAEGVYTVTLTVTNADGCSSTTAQTVTVTAKTATGIGNLTATNGISIYSAGNDVFVGFGELKHVDATIDIYNILGQKVLEDKWTKTGTYTKRLNNLDAAYIVVRVNNNGVITTKKLFITGK